MRGRPKLVMTHRRRQVLDLLIRLAKDDTGMTIGGASRATGLDRSGFKRVVRDLRKMGHVE